MKSVMANIGYVSVASELSGGISLLVVRSRPGGRKWRGGTKPDDARPRNDKKTEPATAGPVRWNFTKFLIGRDGIAFKRFEPDTEPDDPELINAIEKALSANLPQDAASTTKLPKHK